MGDDVRHRLGDRCYAYTCLPLGQTAIDHTRAFNDKLSIC